MNAIIRHETPKSETKDFLTNSIESSLSIMLVSVLFFLFNILYLFGLLGLTGGLGVFNLYCRMHSLLVVQWDVVPCPGFKLRPPALGVGSFSHWITREDLVSRSSHPTRVKQKVLSGWLLHTVGWHYS